jgi:hypothetical protein
MACNRMCAPGWRSAILTENRVRRFTAAISIPAQRHAHRNPGWPFEGQVYCGQPPRRVRFDVMGAMTLPVRKTVENGVIDLQELPW